MNIEDAPKESIIYEDDKLYVCMAHHPLTKGHTIVVWKDTIEDIHLLEREDYLNLMAMVEKVRDSLLKTYGLEKVYILYADEVKHVHWHLVPRYDEKGLSILNHSAPKTSDFSDANRIKQNLEL